MKLPFAIILSLIVYVCVGQPSHENEGFYFQYYNISKPKTMSADSNADYKFSKVREPVFVKPFSFLLWSYKSFLSPQLFTDCEFIPSCSRFSYRAIHELGLIKGIFLTADRLTRCNGSAFKESPSYLTDNENAKVIDIPSFYRSSK